MAMKDGDESNSVSPTDASFGMDEEEERFGVVDVTISKDQTEEIEQLALRSTDAGK